MEAIVIKMEEVQVDGNGRKERKLNSKTQISKNKLSYKFTRRTRRKLNLPFLTPFYNNRPACGGLLVF